MQSKQEDSEYINKIVNPFEFIHTNVPGTILSVSKVKPESSLFFDLMEIFCCNLEKKLRLIKMNAVK